MTPSSIAVLPPLFKIQTLVVLTFYHFCDKLIDNDRRRKAARQLVALACFGYVKNQIIPYLYFSASVALWRIHPYTSVLHSQLCLKGIGFWNMKLPISLGSSVKGGRQAAFSYATLTRRDSLPLASGPSVVPRARIYSSVKEKESCESSTSAGSASS